LRAEEPLLSWIEDSQSTGEELIRRVAEGEIDYTIADSHLFALLRHFYPDLRVAFSLESANHVAWALPKGADELRESIAAYFAEIEATGELTQILDRYYFASREFDYVGSRAFIRHVSTRLPRYRDFFREAALSTGIDWRLLAAMGYQESHWNPSAVSPTGVRGMMMLTERTAQMMEVSDRHDPRSSILGGAHYFRRVLRKVPQRIAEPDRSWLAVAAYNLGYGHVEDARILTQTQGANPDSWEQVRNRLPLLSDEAWFKRVQRGFAAGQTAVTYVDNVRRYYEILMWLDSRETLTSQQVFPPPPALPIG
jgi:membrane-bound lytic murein transglycosylase F